MGRDGRECWMTQRQVVLDLTGWRMRRLGHQVIASSLNWRSCGRTREATVVLDEHSVCRIVERKTCLTSSSKVQCVL